MTVFAHGGAPAQNGAHIYHGSAADYRTDINYGSHHDYRAVADSTNITAGCCKKLTHDEIYDILCECK